MEPSKADHHTIKEHYIDTEDKAYKLYVQEWGNKNGSKILYLHGGPGGSGCEDKHKKLFDPEKHHAIFLDQRGSGLSAPYASIKDNTTQLLVEDIELVRKKLNIEKVSIHGRSWGSTLALCYAIKYPDNVSTIVTGGIYLATKEEGEWLEKNAAQNFYPEVYDKHNSDPDSLLKFARFALPTIHLDDRYSQIKEDEFEEEFLKIEYYYSENKYFLPENYILNNASKIKAPVYIVQGRYDMMTPPKYAYKLHKALPNSTLQWTIAGHTSSDRGNFDVSKAILSQL